MTNLRMNRAMSTARTFDAYEPIETASRDEIAALQLERLRWSLRHAYENVAHTREKFERHGVHPDDLKTLDDLKNFPFTTKQDLRDNYPFSMFAVPREEVVRIHASSGTTGKPTVVGYTKNDIEMWATLMARSIHAAGGRRGDIAHVGYGYGLFTGGLGAHYGAERLGCTVIPMSGGQTEKQVQLIMDFQPDIILVTPSYILNIADEFKRQGIDPASTRLRIGMFGAEPWTHQMRLEIENTFGIDAIDVYGLSEVIGPGVACECIESKDGPVLWEDHFYPEIIDPDTGEVLPDGSQGELVFTSLTKEALPVIRYRTRDITAFETSCCRCGRTCRRIRRISRRSDDMLIIRGVNVYPSQIETALLKTEASLPHYLIVLTRKDGLDQLEVRVEITGGMLSDNVGAMEQLQKRFSRSIEQITGLHATVTLAQPGSITRSEGKAKRLLDQREIPN